MNTKVMLAIGVVVIVIGTFFYTRITPADPIANAATSEECVEASGSWVDTSTEPGCTAANGEWKDEACSFLSYCEPVATEEVEEAAEETETEESEPVEGQK